VVDGINGLNVTFIKGFTVAAGAGAAGAGAVVVVAAGAVVANLYTPVSSIYVYGVFVL